MPEWREADRRALQDVARTAREVASRPEVSADVAEWIEAGADAISDLTPSASPKREPPSPPQPASPPPAD